ncbi:MULTISPECIES: nicotinamide riboside transporter PnuC [unclassified Mucilaginibacter]|uniref:nicotinamide riboside transporter PnuC n=1 Tax=unclassified Mucilaginibacter TaxID=2617802 RepID=UPI000A490247|nr:MULTISPECIES: nicotinamide riboside transporter PnuC [unclassified Mucilaginibacter]PLW88424.1 MAG: nicotinamide riboside transporter PnuC [Mucilaginibacter sp.]HEK21790.1 nicotinamide riboside transporter PnuC [Bacteroidota bacterium]
MQWISMWQSWWQQQTAAEIIAVITGLLCVYLAARNSIWNWPLAIISVSIYIFLFFEKHLYADTGLQFYFLGMNMYGWWYWSHSPAEQKVPFRRVTLKETGLSAAAVVVVTFVLGTVLQYTPASYPYLDSFLAACSLVAQLFLARKVLENWLLWVFVDVIYVGVYMFKDLHLTALMYAIYALIAAKGYIDWRREWKLQQAVPNEIK